MPGCFGKILSYFKKNYSPAKIVTYADLRWSVAENGVYEKNGFRFTHNIATTYLYFRKNAGKDRKRYHKSAFKKSAIRERFPKVWAEGRTEAEMMAEAG